MLVVAGCSSTAKNASKSITASDASLPDAGLVPSDGGTVDSDAGAVVEEGGTVIEEGGTPGCPTGMVIAQQKDVDDATTVLGTWHYARFIRDGQVDPELTACERGISYHFGPDVFGPNDDVRCVLESGKTFAVQGGQWTTGPGGCPVGSCGHNSGFAWLGNGAGAVYALDGNGNRNGAAAFYVARDPSKPSILRWSQVADSTAYYEMERTTSPLQCAK